MGCAPQTQFYPAAWAASPWEKTRPIKFQPAGSTAVGFTSIARMVYRH
jgi:hypothetical protein